MKVEGFIAERLRFEGRMAIIAIAISFFVIILAVSISGGFNKEIHKAVSSLNGDILIIEDSLDISSAELSRIEKLEGIESVEASISMPGIIKKGDEIRGVIFKGTEADTASLSARIPESLAEELKLDEGDSMLSYFIEDRFSARRFTLSSTYSSPVDVEDAYIAYVPISDLRRLKGWEEGSATGIEICMEPKYRKQDIIRAKTEEIAVLTGLRAVSARELYPSLFSWLELIDYNVYAIILLMTIVAGFNMISGLLILLFRNISTIGTLKSMGMTDRSIASVFLRISARITAIGMLAGNAAAILFCLVQGSTKLIRLNPENYFVSYVPVDMEIGSILAADILAFAAIMLLLLIPSLFISKIDPSSTVKTQ